MDSWKIEQATLDQMIPLIREQLVAGQNVRLAPRGTSMLPLLRQGRDSVILSPLPDQLRKYDVPLYQRENGQYVLHRVVRAGKTYTCIGDNQFDLEDGLSHSQMIAVVTAVCRDGKVYPMNGLCQKLYCRLWHYSRPVRHLWRRGVGFLRRCLK